MLNGIDEWGNRKIDGVLEDGTKIISGGVILKEVTDSLSLSDAVLRDKTLTISDSIGLADVSLRDWSPQVADAVALSDLILRDKAFSISDSINLLDQVSTPTRILQALDAIGLSDTAYVNKTLIITDQIGLAEVVEVGKGGVQKTKLFLIFGDLAIQIQ